MKKSLIATSLLLFITGIAIAQNGKTIRKPVSNSPVSQSRNGLTTKARTPVAKPNSPATTKPPRSNFAEYEEKSGKGRPKAQYTGTTTVNQGYRGTTTVNNSKQNIHKSPKSSLMEEEGVIKRKTRTTQKN